MAIACLGVKPLGSGTSQSPQPRLLRQPAPMAFAHAPAVEHYGVADLVFGIAAVLDRPHQIDAGHHRELAHHRALPVIARPSL